MPDQPITCTTCGQRFIWSVGEQQFYRERGLQTPRRCPACRVAKRPPMAMPARTSPSPTPSRPMARQRTPRRTFGVATLLATIALSSALFLVVPSTLLRVWLIAVNVIALLTYGYDKAIAGGHQMRVPEVILLGLAMIGGSPGAFVGMLLFRHKTRKAAFLVPFGLIVALQGALLVGWLVLRPS